MANLLIKEEDLLMAKGSIIGQLDSIEVVGNKAYGYYRVGREILILESIAGSLSRAFLDVETAKHFGLYSRVELWLSDISAFSTVIREDADFYFPEALSLRSSYVGTILESHTGLTLSQLNGRCIKTSNESVPLVELCTIGLSTIDSIVSVAEFSLPIGYLDALARACR